jgi:hypothetical protein
MPEVHHVWTHLAMARLVGGTAPKNGAPDRMKAITSMYLILICFEQVWSCAYVPTWTGFVYVAFVIDTFARRIVGWRASRTTASTRPRSSIDEVPSGGSKPLNTPRWNVSTGSITANCSNP